MARFQELLWEIRIKLGPRTAGRKPVGIDVQCAAITAVCRVPAGHPPAYPLWRRWKTEVVK
ncbi:MAG: hypothetical protein L3J97_03715 [Thermoplasmata archaeon]|nr:hypothetical protein [Thermoplasmata archaeon]